MLYFIKSMAKRIRKISFEKMNKKELKFILQEGEGQFIEFKEFFDAKNLSKEIVSFANASGGKIF